MIAYSYLNWFTMLFRRFFSLMVLLILTVQVHAEEALVHRPDVQRFINQLVTKDKFNRAELTVAMRAAQFQPQIIESMEKPYEKKSWDIYKSLFLTPQRVQAGIEFWQANAETLNRAEKEYGVPAEMIVAILGIETQYGKRQGEYRVLDALTTLAFHYPKRSDYFTRELREYFLLCREHHVSPETYIGSYAGAIGQPQFMPSSYRRFAVDFDGHGGRDLVNNNKDVIGSIANYFKKHGWTPHKGVAQPARLNQRQRGPLAVNSKRPNYAYQKLITSGVSPLIPVSNPPARVGLIELMTDKGSEYWLAYPNFYVITRYNTSPQYALAAYLLAEQLREQRTLALKQGPRRAPSYG